MQPAICLLPVVPLRKEPLHRSEMVSQLLFGEYVMIDEEKDDFVLATCLYDGYQGWVQANQVVPVAEVLTSNTYVSSAQAEIVVNGFAKAISIGSPVYKPGEKLLFGNAAVQYLPGTASFWNSKEQHRPLADVMKKIYESYLYTPYLWGGKSVYGIDCSGFVQQVYKFFGVKLPRDAYLQAEHGAAVSTLEVAKFGDLVFFQNEKGRVMHVGIVIEHNAIVHASGRVRTDVLDNEGIINNETGNRTHRLHSIRRFSLKDQVKEGIT